jgi:hypothetical protein
MELPVEPLMVIVMSTLLVSPVPSLLVNAKLIPALPKPVETVPVPFIDVTPEVPE